MKTLKEIMGGYFEDEIELAPKALNEIAVRPVHAPAAIPTYPIAPAAGRWEIVSSPTRYKKEFLFEDPRSLIEFVYEVLTYQENSRHHGQVTVSQGSVIIEVYTHDVNTITEIDQEYIHHVDNIHVDIEHYHMDKNY